MNLQKKIGNRGFTLVELMIVIVIIGVLAALASFGFMEYVKKSKSAEADEFVRKMGDGAKIYYTSEQKYGGDESAWHPAGAPGSTTAPGYPVPGSEKMFPGGDTAATIWTSATVPTGGGKINPSLTANETIWRLLNYTSTDPTYFRYGYQYEGKGTAAKAWVCAEADFNNDSAEAGDCKDAGTATNQTLVKSLSIQADTGEVLSLPAVLTNQGK